MPQVGNVVPMPEIGHFVRIVSPTEDLYAVDQFEVQVAPMLADEPNRRPDEDEWYEPDPRAGESYEDILGLGRRIAKAVIENG